MITLTQMEIMRASHVGIMRQAQCIRDGSKHRNNGDERNSWQWTVEGALGELALAKYLGMYWTGAAGPGEPDVGKYDVRTTPWTNGKLWFYEDDEPTRYFWLMTGINGTYTPRGMYLAEDGQKPENWSDVNGNGRFCYWVPQSELIWPEGMEK